MRACPVSFPSPRPEFNLERRVEFQKRAYEQAVEDLNAAREAQGLHPLEELEELRPQRDHTPRPFSPAEATNLASQIIAAGRKARGLAAISQTG